MDAQLGVGVMRNGNPLPFHLPFFSVSSSSFTLPILQMKFGLSSRFQD